MILLDFTYLNSGGGLAIMNAIISYLNKNNLTEEIHFLVDKRNFIHLKGKEIRTVINNSEKDRIQFYFKYRKSFKSIFCLANVPPPFHQKSKTLIFFHNELILNPFNSEISFFEKSIFILKKLYINFLNKKDYEWVVQTSHIQYKLSNGLGIPRKEVMIAPIFGDFEYKNKCIKENYFIYPTSNEKHKNNLRLIKAFIMAAKQVSIPIYLEITLTKNELKKIVRTAIPPNLKILGLGTLSHHELILRISRSQFLIFPSLVESFGLPLIEAIQNGCKVLASDLDYVNEIIEPSLVFDPYKVKSISAAIKKALLDNSLKKSKLKVSNKLDMIINQLIKVD